jgi:hypothetical protein
MISGQEVMMKDQSHFKQSTGDEAATRAQGMGVVTHIIQGEASFVAWSMDVKFEGANVDRHLDIMIHNEQCDTANTPPMAYVDASAFGNLSECADDKKKMEDACGKPADAKKACPGALSVRKKQQIENHGGDMNKAGAAAEADAKEGGSAEKRTCVEAHRCYLRPYRPGKEADGCCPGQTGHHIPPKAGFKNDSGKYVTGYSPSSALCVCMEGQNQHCGSHGKNHAAIESLANKKGWKEGKVYDVAEYNSLCAKTLQAQCGCDPACVEAQLKKQLQDKGINEVKHVDTNSSADISEFEDVLESTNLPQNASSNG